MPWTIIDISINGMQDETQDVCVAPFFNKIPKANVGAVHWK
jgi:hypothetical protein